MKYLTHWTVAFLTLAVLMLWGFSDPFVKQTARLKTFDLIQKYDTPTVSNDVVIVELDEKSIEQYGQWPWKRTILADIIWQLREAGAGLIILPILFSEQDRLGGDMDLAEALVDNGVVIAQVGTTQTNKNAVPRGVAKIGDPLSWLFEWPGMLGPIELFGLNADGVGVINTAPEIDGVVRRVPLIVTVDRETYPAISIETIRVATGAPSYQVKAGPGGVQAVRVPGYPVINTDANGQIWLRWNKQFETISVTDSFESVQGKTVIIGITAEGIGSIIATPNGEAYSHTPIAVSLQTIINGDSIVRTDYATFVEYVTAGILAVLLIVMAAFAPYWLIGATVILLWAGSSYASYFVFTRHLQLWDVSWILLVTTIVSFHAVFNRFVKEFQLKQQIKKQFEHYLAPAMVKKLQKNPELLKLGGDTRELTILFSDIRGFTPISEQYKTDPQGLTKLINRYMTPMTDIVMKNDGTVDKYIGDALMAFWNAPLDVPQQKQLAIKTANEMFVALSKLNKELESEGLLPIKIGIGINTGSVVVGNMGSNQRFDYSVLGDAVNLAARLEGQSKEYGLTLLVGETSVSDSYKFIELDMIAVKGKTEPATIYTVLFESVDSEFFNKHNDFLKFYRNAQWINARQQIEQITTQYPQILDKYYNVMLQRIINMEQQKIKTWNGVYVATTK